MLFFSRKESTLKNRSIDYTMREYLPEKKGVPMAMKTYFSKWKLIKHFGNVSFLKEPPFQVTLYLSEIVSWPPSLFKFQEKEPPFQKKI